MEIEIKKGSIVHHQAFGDREVVEVRNGFVYIDFGKDGPPVHNRNIIKADGKYVFGFPVDSVKDVSSPR